MFKQEVSRHLQDLRDFADAEWFKSFPPSSFSVSMLCPWKVNNNIEYNFELNVSWLSLDIVILYDPSELPEISKSIKCQSAYLPIHV